MNSMMTRTVALFLLLSAVCASPGALAENDELRIFMFSSRPNSNAWKFMIENPGDRQAATADAIKSIGGEMLGYYWRLKDARNYIIVALPDNETVMAMLIQRLSGGLVHEYEAIELLRSTDMPRVFERLKELNAADSSM